MNQFHFKPLTLGLLTASVLTLAGLGLFASRTQAADAPRPLQRPRPRSTVSTVQAKSSQLPVKLSANGGVAAWQRGQCGRRGQRPARGRAACGCGRQREARPGAGYLCL